MWANRAWVGRWFPEDTAPGRELEAYASWCTTVEGNTTFYATPDPATIHHWAEQVPESFRFCFKLPRAITHERRLRNCAEELTSFLRRIDALAPNLGPVQIQLPASFGPDGMDALQHFVAQLSSAFQWAIEVRHPDFFAGGDAERPLDDFLAAKGINRVILDSRALFAAPPETEAEREAHEAKPRVPVRAVATADQPLIRLIGRTDAAASLEMWEPWFPKLAAWMDAGLSPHVFAHTPDNRDAPELARAVWTEVNRLFPGLDSLPEPRTASEQLRLPGPEGDPTSEGAR